MISIDLNADMGEYQNENERLAEDALMASISSCSIACGGHTGDKETIRYTMRSAKRHGVSVGAHPSYPDRDGFGRVSLEMDPALLRRALAAQLTAIKKIATDENIHIAHVKPHGALYNDAAHRLILADLIATITKSLIPGAALFGPPNSTLMKAAENANISFVSEGFIDRLYQNDGSLTPRSKRGAVITDLTHRLDQGIRLARGAPIEGDGGTLTLDVKTLCIHSDSEGASDTAKALRIALEEAGICVAAPTYEPL